MAISIAPSVYRGKNAEFWFDEGALHIYILYFNEIPASFIIIIIIIIIMYIQTWEFHCQKGYFFKTNSPPTHSTDFSAPSLEILPCKFIYILSIQLY